MAASSMAPALTTRSPGFSAWQPRRRSSGVGSDRTVLLDHTFVLDRHLPAGERHHPRPERDVAIVYATVELARRLERAVLSPRA